MELSVSFLRSVRLVLVLEAGMDLGYLEYLAHVTMVILSLTVLSLVGVVFVSRYMENLKVEDEQAKEDLERMERKRGALRWIYRFTGSKIFRRKLLSAQLQRKMRNVAMFHDRSYR